MRKILLGLTVLFTLAGIFTLIPDANIEKSSLLGYRAHCSFAPISTIICFAIAGAICVWRKKKFAN